MKQVGYYCKSIWLATGWAENVSLSLNSAGYITSIEFGENKHKFPILEGFVIPGMPNVHSHSFQRAMAGLSQKQGKQEDTFWTWRNLMYETALRFTEKEIEDITFALYVEMLKKGYTTVGEFHYLHHQPNGMPYQNRATVAHRIIHAAQKAGIGITLLPVFYAFSNFGAKPPLPEQRRFINDVKSFEKILLELTQTYVNTPQVKIGVAPHSLRAVSPDTFKEVVSLMHSLDAEAPIHIHIAEQQKEVNDCLDWHQKRPVSWLFDSIDLDAQWCLIHATHLSEEELLLLAQSPVVVGLCPTTEADLGDGLFPLIPFHALHGKWAIGSDSNCILSPIEELRWLEYQQRLLTQKRNVLQGNAPSTGTSLYQQALSGGAQALGQKVGKFAEGYRFDALILDNKNSYLAHKKEAEILDTYIFSGTSDMIQEVFVAGKHVIVSGKHFTEIL